MRYLFFEVLVLFVFGSNISVHAQRLIIRRNTQAFVNAIKKIESKSSDALFYRNAIQDAFYTFITRKDLTDKAKKQAENIKDYSIKYIDSYAHGGDYSQVLDIAMEEYSSVLSSFKKIADEDLKQQAEYEVEKKRIYQNTHPFDNKNYSSYTHIITAPTYRCNNIPDLKITKIAYSSDSTRIELLLTHPLEEGWAGIERTTYLYDSIHKKKYYLLKADNISIMPNITQLHHRGEQLKFALIFPGIPRNVTYVDLIEGKDSPWKFYKIKLR